MSDTAPLKPRSRLRRVTGFTLKGTAVLVAGAVLYISIPAVQNASRLTSALDRPHVQALLDGAGISGSDLRDMKGGVYVSAFAMQGLATLLSAISGLSVQSEFSDTWEMGDSVLELLAQPGPHKYGLMTTSCYGGARRTTLQGIRAHDSYPVQAALERAVDGDRFQPMTPWITKELYDLEEVDSQVLFSIRKQPKPLWHFPYVGPFKDSRDRRADVVKLLPELGTIDCAQDRSKALTIAESMAAFPGAEALVGLAARGAAPGPAAVELAGLPNGVAEVGVNPYSGQTDLGVSWKRWPGADLPANFRRGYERLDAALRSQGPLQMAIRMHTDSGTAAGKSIESHTYQLRDGAVSVSRGYQNGRAELHLSWRPEAPAEPEFSESKLPIPEMAGMPD